MMYRKLPNLVLGFHGCNKEVYDKVILKQEALKKSENTYDWLGHGIYFWEQNFTRAQEWAVNRYGTNNACVVGAVIDLGCCLNLTDSYATSLLAVGFELLKVRCEAAGIELPVNRPSTKSTDILLRDLDCAVVQQIHDYAAEKKREGKMMEFDSVRGIFVEGNPPYPGAEFREKTHVQICIRTPNCIKGYFNPLAPDENYVMP